MCLRAILWPKKGRFSEKSIFILLIKLFYLHKLKFNLMLDCKDAHWWFNEYMNEKASRSLFDFE